MVGRYLYEYYFDVIHYLLSYKRRFGSSYFCHHQVCHSLYEEDAFDYHYLVPKSLGTNSLVTLMRDLLSTVQLLVPRVMRVPEEYFYHFRLESNLKC